MSPKTKNIVLAVVLVVIVAFIVFLEAQKPKTTPAVTIPLPDIDSGIVATSTAPAPASATSSVVTKTKTVATPKPDRTNILAQKASLYPRAKELSDIQGYINTPQFKLSDLVGKKVILLDFWTYSCINCIRTLPYLNSWFAKYKGEGLVIVGVHTPEFGFEKVYDNVLAAVKKFGIMYPVVLDSNMGTWNAYNNEYWPAEYLIDIDGYVVHTNLGEGDYDVTEQAIQSALKERDTVLGLTDNVSTGTTQPNGVISTNTGLLGSPETYFGSARNEYLGNGTQASNGQQSLTVPVDLKQNTLYLGGIWNFQNEYAQSVGSAAKVVYKFSAKNVYLVGSSDSGATAKVLLDGKPIGSAAGSDVSADGTISIKDNRLYYIVNASDYGQHVLEIDIESGSLDAYTFTFG